MYLDIQNFIIDEAQKESMLSISLQVSNELHQLPVKQKICIFNGEDMSLQSVRFTYLLWHGIDAGGQLLAS